MSEEGSDKEETSDEIAEEGDEPVPPVDFNEKSWKTDFTLIVQGTKLYVSKAILAVASPVFDRMFQSGFREKSQDILELPGKKVEDVREFLRCIYPNTIAQVTFQNALRILPLVEEYQVVQLKPRCEKVLIDGIDAATSTETLFMLLKETSLYNMKALSKRCISYASERSKYELEDADHEFPLPPKILGTIYHNVTARLEGRVYELEDDVSDLKNQVYDLEDANTRFEEQVESYKKWKTSLTACMNATPNLQLSEKFSWSGRTFILEMNINEINPKPVKKNFVVWCTRFNIELAIEYPSTLSATVRSLEENTIDCTLETQFVVMNQLHAEQSLSLKSRFVLNRITKQRSCQITNLKAIKDPEKGFHNDGNMQLMVYVFVSKPAIQW